MLGGPGSGKGSLCTDLIKLDQRFIHLSAGQVLRDECERGSKLSDQINQTILEGKIVPVEITLNLLMNLK